ncbi:metallophosphoesterase [Lactobacillus sp. CC-MHH1034]|uniref:metallophosphoesterase n=1 Tax=Agrilactobacillus fermenti TaxID=2586909 RepID=UPI001E63273C|nr:metallophosphoesterase [Agrilactobacillus fermenti]MCD2255642.1 metallophosphoesterase [Agrilactobacillus fermenti]
MTNTTTDLIVSDIHGFFNPLQKIAHIPEFNQMRLVFLGDFIDRGQDSLAVLQYIQNAVKTSNALAIRGDHEDLLLGYLFGDRSDQKLYLQNGGETTLINLLGAAYDVQNIKQNQTLIKDRYSDLIQFIESLPYFYQDEHRLYVHGGIYPQGLAATSDFDKTWLREDYWFQTHHWNERHSLGYLTRREVPNFGHNPVAQTIVTGHTITTMIYGKVPESQGKIKTYGQQKAPVLAIEYENEAPRIFIDGGSYIYSNLNFLKLDPLGKVQNVYQLD